MFRKSFAAIMTLMLAIFVTGCGNDAPKISADKSILAWTELYATGTSSHLADAGIPASSEQDIKDTLNKNITGEMKDFPLNDKNIEEVTKYFLNHLKDITKVTTTLKSNDAKNPVVEVKAVTIDTNADQETLMKNDGIQTLMETVQASAAQGKSIDDMKKDAAFQNIAIESVKLFIDNLPTVERTLDVKCTVGKGEDGKTLYWMPENPEALAVFAQGR